jgi:hypothetical protein
VEGATSQVFTAEHSGSYSVEVTENECLDTSVCYSIIGAGLDPDFTASIRVYPNPTNGLIVLEGPGLANFKYVEIRSAHGTLVYQSNLDALNRTELNPELAAGNYMIRLVSETELITLHLVVIN